MRTLSRLFRVVLPTLLLIATGWASITGSISGVVSDASGAIVAGAHVTAVNKDTGVQSETTTNDKGFYSFPTLPVGTYDLLVEQTGFRKHHENGIVVDTNAALRKDIALQVGQVFEQVTVQSESVHVETESTQMGEVITGKRIVAVPLNGRSYIDLLSLQPGVSPYTINDTGTAGLDDRSVSGGLNAGNQSVNGQRETANGFMVNGSNVEEGKNNGAAIIPNLDSISEFRIITNNFDAEYGNYSGGQINVVTKSGNNSFHGSGFEFLRNTSLDAKDFFSLPSDPTPVFRQNQFGGTFGGPIRKDKTFFFVDYQGTRQTRGLTQNQQVPSLLNRGGDLSAEAQADAFSTTQTINSQDVQVPTVVNGAYFANLLAGRLNYAVSSGEPYYFLASDVDPNTQLPYGVNCTLPTQCVFPNGVIPQIGWSPAAVQLLQFIPKPNAPSNFFVTSASAQTLRDDKGGVRVDQNTSFGSLFGYYFNDDYSLDTPYPNGGATVPGFNATTTGRAQLVNIGWSKNFGTTAVNEFRFSYVRNSLALTQPQGGLGQSLASLGFTTPWNAVTGGIAPIYAPLEGVPYITFNNYALGVPQVTTRQFNNSFQWLDNFSKVIGKHTMRFGGQFHYDQINERNFAGENGQYSFTGSETGIDFADFLIGAPDSLTQASPQILDSRTKYYGLYGQDTWRVAPTLTLSYGLRWEASLPWYDTQNKIETIVPGLQSKVFPGAPTGWVVPGDPGIPRTLSPTRWNNFGPRVGLAYSPSASSGVLGKLFGGPGRTSVRIGAGIYYTSVEDLSQFLEVGDPPYGLYYGSPAPPVLETPYIDRATGNSEGQRFPFAFPPTNVSAKNPDTTFNWAGVEPISYGFSFDHRNRLPYSEHYEFSLQRQIGSNSVVAASYVGNQGHHLVTSIEANPANPALCLFLSDPANLDPASPVCGPFSETPSGGPYITSTGQVIPSVRPLGPLFDTNPFVSTVANSSYNSFQASLAHNTGSLSVNVGYTFSKCLDNASGLQDSTYPFDHRKSIGLCNFDVVHNFVVSYNWLLPFDKLGVNGWAKRLVQGWSLSGITNFATGLPISLMENDDNALVGANAVPVDVPNFAGGHVLADTNPRHRNAYFNTSLFSNEQLGQFGNSRRRFFHGPGLNNFDMALQKSTKIIENTELQLRFEAFNVFNHAQFNNPSGEINSSTFGLITSARDPRIMQVAARFTF